MTIAKPEKIAPATKYGGKIVECHPGSKLAEKSKLTIVCTDTTSGVASPASSRYAVWYRFQCRADPRHPIARTPYAMRENQLRARSRSVARSGISPTYQNS